MDKVYIIMVKDWFDGHFESNELYNDRFYVNKSKAEDALNNLNSVSEDDVFIYARKDGVNYAIRLDSDDEDYDYYKGESDECKNNYYWMQEGHGWHYIEELKLK